MKQRILFLLLALCMLLPLSSCGAKEQYDLLYSVEMDGLTYCVRGNGTRAKQVAVKRGEELVWTKKEKADKAVGSQNGTYGLSVADYNFDGHLDLALATAVEGDALLSVCWLYDPEKDTYTESEALSGLGNLKADADLGAIFSFAQGVTITKAPSPDFPSITTSVDSVTKHTWENGVLTPQTRVSILYYSETSRYCYRVEYYNQESGEFEIDQEKWLTPEEYKTVDWSFVYYFK